MHRDTSYDIIFLDCDSSGANAHDATSDIRRRDSQTNHERTPVIALTTHAVEGDRERCIRAGMDDYMSKPITVEGMSDMLQRWRSP